MKKIGILTSGGDAPGMNAAVRAAVRCGIERGMEVYGIKRGYEGLLDGEIVKMEWHSVGDILQRGGTILRTARSARFMEQKWVDHGARMLEAFGIDGLIVVGGDGSFRGGVDLSKRGISVMGVPGTIDNDLAYTDFTIGFDTAVNTILGLISNIRDTSSSHERSTIMEVMGRHCGDLALYSGLAGGADVILVPEVKCDINEVCRRVLQGQATGKAHSLIVMAEGFDMDATELAKTLEEMTGREARAVVPGYIQRGGSPTALDIKHASMMGYLAVEALAKGETNRVIAVQKGAYVDIDIDEGLAMKKTPSMDIWKANLQISTY